MDEYTVNNELIPGWFTKRMMDDEWYFALLVTTGDIIGISHINSMYQSKDGSVWIDVELLTDNSYNFKKERMLISPTSRTSASINTSHIITAFELADT